MSLHVAFLFHYSYNNDLLQLVLWPSFLLCLLHGETIASYKNAGQQDANLCAIRQCRMSKNLERRKSRVCFLNYLLLLRKQVVLLQIVNHLLFHMCVFWSCFFFFFQKFRFFVLFLYIKFRYGYLLEEEKDLCQQNGTIGVTRLL